MTWGTIRIVADCGGGQYGSQGGIDISDEDQWGFGQIVAVMLLLSPFVSFFGVSYGKFAVPGSLQQPYRTQSDV